MRQMFVLQEEQHNNFSFVSSMDPTVRWIPSHEAQKRSQARGDYLGEEWEQEPVLVSSVQCPVSTLSSPGKHELLTSCVTACSRHPDCSSHTWHPLCQAVCRHPLSYPVIWTLITNNFYFYSWSTISHHGIEEMILVCVCILLLHLLCRYCVNNEAELQTPDSRCSRWAVTSNKNRAVSISTFTIHFIDV